jgi:nucleotidyltransferase/DNA polymerase involved in DNA repair
LPTIVVSLRLDQRIHGSISLVKEILMKAKPRELADLISVGPAILRDFELLGVRSVAQLARQNPHRLYEKLCRKTGQRIDVCCLDVFVAAVAQARNPLLPTERGQWWYWSRKRKREHR